MSEYKKILVALDPFMDCAQIMNKAMVKQGDDAEIHLIHVMDILMIFPSASLAPPSPDLPGIHEKTKDDADKALAKIAAQYDIPVGNTHIKIGSPAKEIRKYAAELEADLIVTGSHGRHGIGLLLGSTASSIIHGSPCDTLVVKIK